MADNFFEMKAGQSEDRVESKAKVTGAAQYAAEYKIDGLLYGVLVTSTIAKGRIQAIDSKKAERVRGVHTVLSHLNRPDVPGWNEPPAAEARVEGKEFRVFFDDKIYYDHQPVALVIADTLERANEGAALVKVSYQKEKAETNPEAGKSKAFKPKRAQDYHRGDKNALQTAAVKIEANYTTPLQVHNPMEMHAATVHWKADGKITHYNKTQAVKVAQKDIVTAFKLAEENVEVHSPFVGGAFGSSSRVWPQEMAALLAAKKTGRPVTVMAKRDQVFNMVGYRPYSSQKISIGATTEGKLISIQHDVIGSSSTYEQFTERLTDPTKTLYACPNMHTTYRMVSLDMSTPCWTRGPGETSGSFALESGLDELSYALKMDPLVLREKNFAEKDPEKNIPWSSNHLQECYTKGAQLFGWNKRNPSPRSMKSGDWLVGMGMAAGIYKSDRSPASASANFKQDGLLYVKTSVADVGPGSATVMSQIAAEAFGIELSKVRFAWGNSSLPPAPGQFGSHTTASVGAAVHEVVKVVQQKLLQLSSNVNDSFLQGKKVEDVLFEDGNISLKNGSQKISYVELLKQTVQQEMSHTMETKVGEEKEKFSGKSYCAHFAEVMVHEATGRIKINRVVTAVDAGRIINQKTAKSQVYGSIAWGIGIALMEEGIVDHRYGRYVNNNLADYHLPVNADIPAIDVIFIDKADPVINPMGSKGLGEIGLIGFPAAIANAVYHATGKRVRDLPITPDKLL